MKQIAEQAGVLVKDMQTIADRLAEYNPGLCKDKTPLPVIQYDVASLARELAILHGEIGEKIKNDTN